MHVWIALAGHDREEVSRPIDKAIERCFRRSIGNGLTVSTDVELLATVAGAQKDTESIVVLIAGTGTIAMKLVKQADMFVRTCRVGGWGPLLGDDGSGFDIGRKALRYAPAEIDEWGAVKDNQAMTALSEQVVRYFMPEHDIVRKPDLLTKVLMPKPGQHRPEQDLKHKIAGIAPQVIEASSNNIVDGAITDLVRMIGPLLQTEERDAPSPVLVLAGGLMKSSIFRDGLQASSKGSLSRTP